MTIVVDEQAMILHDLRVEAEAEYATRGWSEGEHRVWVHVWCETRAVQMLCAANRRIRELEARRS